MDATLDGDIITDDADSLRRQPTKIGQIAVTKGRMETAMQFYARQEARRGTRIVLDEALAMARDALDGDLTPMARALVQLDQALVRKALNDDPLGIKALSLEVLTACLRLEPMDMAVRVQAEANRLRTASATEQAAHIHAPGIEARREKVRAEMLNKHRTIKWLAKKFGVSESTIKRDLKNIEVTPSS